MRESHGVELKALAHSLEAVGTPPVVLRLSRQAEAALLGFADAAMGLRTDSSRPRSPNYAKIAKRCKIS